MRLATLRLRNVGPFEDTTVRFVDEGAEGDTPRPLTILFGGDGTGKTSLLASAALTRPGHALPPLVPGAGGQRPGEPPSVLAEWLLGDDDPSRPHPLLVTSPSALVPNESAEEAVARRREQTIFDRRASHEGGFVFLAFSGARWFSKSAAVLTAPDRTLLRYDVRAASTFDDPARADLTRETKQMLVYAAVARALGRGRADGVRFEGIDGAVREVVSSVLERFGLDYSGVGMTTLEPEARDRAGSFVPFDAWPRAAKHLVAFTVLPLRALFAAYPGRDDPRELEGVVAIDDIELHQDAAHLVDLLPLLAEALPNVQWIVSTSSTQLALAWDAEDVVALRRDGGHIEASSEVLQ